MHKNTNKPFKWMVSAEWNKIKQKQKKNSKYLVELWSVLRFYFISVTILKSQSVSVSVVNDCSEQTKHFSVMNTELGVLWYVYFHFFLRSLLLLRRLVSVYSFCVVLCAVLAFDLASIKEGIFLSRMTDWCAYI